MKTDITFILDRSGSMQSIRDDIEGGFNSFIEEQKKVKGECLVSLVQFDDVYERVFNQLPLTSVPKLKITPRGSTALLDSIGKTILNIGERLLMTAKSSRPDNVLVIIMTDGYENASKEFNRKQINEMISHQEDKYQWDFIFIGANQDAIKEGSSLGISMNNSLSFATTSESVKNVYESLSSNVVNYRNANSRTNAVASMKFNDDQRKKVK